jgi:hypothetical protein
VLTDPTDPISPSLEQQAHELGIPIGGCGH